ncbi:hypothetical protein BDY21DRAFT_331950 [Lineolata rhizophorae]|uniref:RRM domain-containing protein n=1 Tax=Lineolata rhizophorae TaxID=578093 RepID=A0A6A6PBV6_9PEZI|nr:hypothetical protein BDY21DRAFT_331950 [Lineolata rhizophorae]
MGIEERPKKRKGGVTASSRSKKLKPDLNSSAKPVKDPKEVEASKVKASKASAPSRMRAVDFYDSDHSNDEALASDIAAADFAVKNAALAEGAAGSEEEAEDDQTAALLKGFESSGDEADLEKEDDGLPLDKVPNVPKAKKVSKPKASSNDSSNQGPRVIYVGRIPHGFYEHQMRAYFTQFGDITRLRLSRNRKTGRSKHYAFVEFAHAEVADIVARTMDKYLLFGHLLQVRVIPPEQVHPNLFRGANKRFKAVPRNRIEARHLRYGMVREGWERRLTREEARRQSKLEKLKDMGYEFNAPTLKAVDQVPSKKAQPAEAAEAQEPKAIADKPADEETLSLGAEEKDPEAVKVTETKVMKPSKTSKSTVVEKTKVKKGKMEDGATKTKKAKKVVTKQMRM